MLPDGYTPPSDVVGPNVCPSPNCHMKLTSFTRTSTWYPFILAGSMASTSPGWNPSAVQFTL